MTTDITVYSVCLFWSLFHCECTMDFKSYRLLWLEMEIDPVITQLLLHVVVEDSKVENQKHNFNLSVLEVSHKILYYCRFE